jgi:transcription elongation factor
VLDEEHLKKALWAPEGGLARPARMRGQSGASAPTWPLPAVPARSSSTRPPGASGATPTWRSPSPRTAEKAKLLEELRTLELVR